MARANSTPLNDLIECSKCTEVFTDPRTLPCLHTFCFRCCEGFCRDKSPGSEVECPLCRESFVIPLSGVDGLRKSFVIESLKQHLQIGEPHTNGKTDVEVEGPRTPLPSFCDQHADKTLDWFCVDCEQVACSSCKNKYHNAHCVLDVDDVAKELRATLTSEVIKLDILYKKWELYLKKVNDEELKFIKTAEMTEAEISNKAIRLQQLLERRKSALLAELSVKTRERLKILDNTKQELYQQMASVKSLINYTTELISNRPEGDIAKEASRLGKQATELQELYDNSAFGSNLGSYSLAFAPRDAKEFAMGHLTEPSEPEHHIYNVAESNQQGSLEAEAMYGYQAAASDELTFNPGDIITDIEFIGGGWWRGSCRDGNGLFPANYVQVKLPNLRNNFGFIYAVTHVIAASEDREGDVRGLTICGDELFLVRQLSEGHIEVYNATSFEFNRYITVEKTIPYSFYGLTSCDTNNCLYVSCWNDELIGCIARVELTGDNKVDQWTLMNAPLGLSVNSEHNLVVTCRGSDRLIEYTTRGELVREILLPNDVEWPRHAIQLSSSQFLVSHGGGGGDSLHRVCVVDTIYRRVLLRYGYKSGSPAGQLSEPHNVAVDRNGFIFVADLKNSRIVVLDSTLKWSCDLKMDGGGSGVKQPHALFLDKRRNLLFVGELNGDDSRVVVVAV